MKKTLLVIGLCSWIFVSCSNSSSDASNDAALITDSSNHAVQPADAGNIALPGNTPVNGIEQQVISAPPPAGGAAPATGAGLNPAHGQPGHRCELAVGAPLNSAPATPSANPATANPVMSMPQTMPVQTSPTSPAIPVGNPISTPTQVTTPAKTTPVQTAPGMNPPHGEPGHDCSIAVGAPLKK